MESVYGFGVGNIRWTLRLTEKDLCSLFGRMDIKEAMLGINSQKKSSQWLNVVFLLKL